MDIEELRDHLLALPATRRAELAHLLIASLDPEPEAGTTSAWHAEVQRRAHEITSGVADGHPADDVFNEIRQRFS